MPITSGPIVASRRRLLLVATASIGAGLALLTSNSARAAKASKPDVGYQDVPKGTQTCANCVLFEGPNLCTSVEGEVNGIGWCRIWVEKRST